jgi:hypothetical protein
MMSIQCKPEPNALTMPQSYSIRFVARNSAGLDDLASDIVVDSKAMGRFICEVRIQQGCVTAARYVLND